MFFAVPTDKRVLSGVLRAKQAWPALAPEPRDWAAIWPIICVCVCALPKLWYPYPLHMSSKSHALIDESFKYLYSNSYILNLLMYEEL